MSYKCVIVDDEELARELIETHLKEMDDFELVASCKSAIEANNILKNEHVDLLFLDIEMPVLKGTDFFRNLLNKPKVISTTAYRDYAIEGFDLNAIDYVLKPITFQRFFKAVEKFLLTENNSIKSNLTTETTIKKDFIYVRSERKQVKINFDTILYIERLKDYVKIYTADKNYVTKYGISAFYKELDDRFTRTHRSYIVNLNKITAYTKNDIEIDKFEIPIGENYKENIMNLLQ
jgi:DNA-binding LytR/AlgR family response regulator